jgi:hypothetical protein
MCLIFKIYSANQVLILGFYLVCGVYTGWKVSLYDLFFFCYRLLALIDEWFLDNTGLGVEILELIEKIEL